MTVETLPRPSEVDNTSDDWDHLFCECDPDVGLCGADLSGYAEAVDGVPPEHACPLCVAVFETVKACLRCGQ